MDDVNSYLVEWSIIFLKNKDAIRKEIVKIGKNQEGFDFIINYNDKIKYFIVKPLLENDIFSKVNGYFGIITMNNPINIRFVVSNWKRLTEFRFLSIYFINPFSTSDMVWTINPHAHDKICDKASLENGLKSLAEMVEPIGVEELSRRVKLLRGESGL